MEERVVVGDRSLLVVLPRDSEALIDEERFARDEFLPYWAELWPSARALALVVAELRLSGAGGGAGAGAGAGAPAAVVELGCGLGLPSLVAAAGGARVLATDWAPEALPFVAENARRNGLTVELLECGWAAPGPIVAAGPFELVLASDVLYERVNVALLVALLPQVVAHGGQVLLADPGRPALAEFLDAMRERCWTIEQEPPAAERARAVVYRLRSPD